MKSGYTRPDATPPSPGAESSEKARIPPGASPLRLAQSDAPAIEHAWDPLEGLSRCMLEEVGEDPGREGLVQTPRRMAKALRFLTSGYEADVGEILNGALFDAEDYAEPILVQDIEFYSLCEHHLLPFFGKVNVAYRPNGKIIGLSKIPRLVDVFARRLQVQERLTQQIAAALEEVLAPQGVAVSVSAFHLCMAMRGVQKQASQTTTTAFTGAFQRERRLRKEFLALLHAG